MSKWIYSQKKAWHRKNFNSTTLVLPRWRSKPNAESTMDTNIVNKNSLVILSQQTANDKAALAKKWTTSFGWINR